MNKVDKNILQKLYQRVTQTCEKFTFPSSKEEIVLYINSRYNDGELGIFSKNSGEKTVYLSKSEVEVILPSILKFVEEENQDRARILARKVVKFLDQNDIKCNCNDFSCVRCESEAAAKT